MPPANTKFIGKLISIKYTDRKTPLMGVVIDYNDHWTLMKYNKVDYVMDGFLVFRHKNIEGFRREENEKFTEKIIKLKGQMPTKDDKIPLDNLEIILSFLTEKFGLFQFYTKSETACYVGKLKSIDSKHLVIDYMNTRGQWDGTMTFRPGDVRVIEFDTDYLNSLKLVTRFSKS